MTERSIPDLFWNRVAKHPDRPMQRSKRYGQWLEASWRQVGEEVKGIALGLIDLGHQPGDAVALLSQSRPEWVRGDLGILSAGGVTIPIYPSLLPEQTQYVINDSESKFLIVEDKAQLQKALKIKTDIPQVRTFLVIDPSGCKLSDTIVSFEQLVARGKKRDEAEMRARLEAIQPNQVATIVYTSGTTGNPKGVVQTHANHLAATQAAASIGLGSEDDVDLLFLPLAHSFARLEEYTQLRVGTTTAFAERIETVVENLAEVRPTIVFSVPRIYEKIYAKVLAGAQQGPPLKQKVFAWSLDVGRQVSQLKLARQPIPPLLALQYRIATKLVFSKLHDKLGGRLKYFISGGAPLAREIGEFFHAAGLLILEGYGLTETCPVLTVNRPEHYKFGTVGPALPGVELKIAPDGEILGRGANIALGYYKRDQDTKDAFLADGWFATGDIGEIDGDGFLKITDRKKDLIVTSAGKNIAPQNIENLLKNDPLISQAMAYGDKRKYVVALVTLDPEQGPAWAKTNGIADSSPSALANDPKMIAKIQAVVDEVNKKLASFEQVKYFRIVPQDFSVETGDLTPTLKVKRKVVTTKYQAVLDSMYASAGE
ncbi:MAG: long-chain fatty acid--CoA ligase [bacterium]